MLDLAIAVERNCFFWNRISAGEDEAYDLAHARLLVEAYHDVSPLTDAERAAFTDVLAACQFEYGISFLDYYWGIERDRDKADWAWHTFVIGHAHWWQSAAGRRREPRSSGSRRPHRLGPASAARRSPQRPIRQRCAGGLVAARGARSRGQPVRPQRRAERAGRTGLNGCGAGTRSL